MTPARSLRSLRFPCCLGDVYIADMEETICYLCLEECMTKSPCECKSFIHRECQHQLVYRTSSGTCTVCRCPYTNVRMRSSINFEVIRILILLSALVICGSISGAGVIVFSNRGPSLSTPVSVFAIMFTMTCSSTVFVFVSILAYVKRSLFFTQSVTAVIRDEGCFLSAV